METREEQNTIDLILYHIHRSDTFTRRERYGFAFDELQAASLLLDQMLNKEEPCQSQSVP